MGMAGMHEERKGGREGAPLLRIDEKPIVQHNSRGWSQGRAHRANNTALGKSSTGLHKTLVNRFV